VKLYVPNGSFTVKTTGAKDIITSEQTLRNAGEGAGVIVLIPQNPTDQVLCIYIKTDKPQPGMIDYTWELLTTAVGLQLVKFMSNVVKGHPDCMSAIIPLNDAMLALHDTQSSITVSELISVGYKFWAAEKDTRDITIKISDIEDFMLISWIRPHPEKDKCVHKFNTIAKGIFMADVVAALVHEIVKTMGSTRLPVVQVKTLELIVMFQ
jgi:hypothetical protein